MDPSQSFPSSKGGVHIMAVYMKWLYVLIVYLNFCSSFKFIPLPLTSWQLCCRLQWIKQCSFLPTGNREHILTVCPWGLKKWQQCPCATRIWWVSGGREMSHQETRKSVDFWDWLIFREKKNKSGILFSMSSFFQELAKVETVPSRSEILMKKKKFSDRRWEHQ